MMLRPACLLTIAARLLAGPRLWRPSGDLRSAGRCRTTAPACRTTAPACLLLILAAAWPAWAGDAEPLTQAWLAFQRGQSDQVIQQVQALLPSLTRPQELRDAHLLLGACSHLRGQTDLARDQIITALSFDLTYQPDPLLLSPDLQQLVEQIQRDHQTEIKARAAGRPAPTPALQVPATRPAASSPPPTVPLVRPPAPEPTPLHLAMLPFGVGQFANGHHAKAWTLLTVEGGLMVTSLSCLMAALSLSDVRGQYSPDVIDTARALNVVYLISAYTAGAVMLYGLVDGLYHRRGSAPPKTTWITPSGVAPGGHAGASLSLTHHF